MEDLFREMLVELRALNMKLDDVSSRLPITGPVHNLDDIHEKLSQTADDITGPSGFHLGDIHAQLVAIESAIDLK